MAAFLWAGTIGGRLLEPLPVADAASDVRQSKQPGSCTTVLPNDVGAVLHELDDFEDRSRLAVE